MRFSPLMFAAAIGLSVMSPAQADDSLKLFKPDGRLELAQAGRSEDRDRSEDPADQEERDREQERRDREERRRDRAEARRDRVESHRERDVSSLRPRAWIGVGAGAGVASITVPCSSSSTNYDCNQSGDLATYSANVTITGPYTALRLRGVRQQDKGDDRHTPYEEAALVGSRFGTSNWYGLAGVGRVQHLDDKHPDDTHGFAWEILFAPSTFSATGMELSFQGELGNDIDYVGLNLGLRFGALQ